MSSGESLLHLARRVECFLPNFQSNQICFIIASSKSVGIRTFQICNSISDEESRRYCSCALSRRVRDVQMVEQGDGRLRIILSFSHRSSTCHFKGKWSGSV
jgi:hypothetical protein